MEKILDIKDRRILAELDMNARQSNLSIAKKTGLSHDAVNYRIKRLEKRGIIQGYYSVIDISRMGHHYIRGWLKLHKASNEEEDAIIKYMLESRRFGFVVKVGGRFDLAFTVNVKSVYDLEPIIDLIMEKYGEYVKELHYSIASKVYFYENAFIYPEKGKGTFVYIGRKPIECNLDEKDLLIIHILSEDARISLVKLASRIEISMKSLVSRINKLEKDNILIAYRPQLNYQRLGYHYYKLFLVCNNLNEKVVKEMIAFGNLHPNIVYFVKAISQSQVEYELIVKNDHEFFLLLREIRQRFKDKITDFYYNHINEEYRAVYLDFSSILVDSHPSISRS